MYPIPTDYNALTQFERKKVREQYAELQKGRCWYCDCPLEGNPSDVVKISRVDPALFPTGFFMHPVHLHHNHTNGRTIGAVHARCNAVLWQYHGE